MNVLESLYGNIYILTFSIIGVSYLVYYYIFSYFTVRMKGDYDVSKKKYWKVSATLP